MKKINKMWVLSLASLMLCGCGDGNSSETSSIAGPSSESSSIETVSQWGKELESLMKKYCGEVLPYPTGLISENISFKETTGTNGETILQITDDSEEFTLGDYYQSLEKDGWYTVKGYTKVERTSNDLPFYELTKGSGKTGYDLSYTFRNATEATISTEAIPAGNVILCYNNLTTELTSNTSWTDDNLDAMTHAITVTLPFMALGEGYVTHWSSEDVLLIYDYSIHDLREDFVKVLENDGFVLNQALSKVYNMHILYKRLPDGSQLAAGLSYTNGNYFQFSYSAMPQTSTTWPSDVLEEIKEATGITIPDFYSSDIEKYYYYSKNGKVYIYAETQTNFEYNTDYYSRLEKAGLYGDGWGNFANWDETLSLTSNFLYNQEGEVTVQYGYQIIVQLTEPTSGFATSWPTDAVSSFLKEKNINVSYPIPSLSSEKEIKYSVNDDGMNESMDVKIFDTNYKNYDNLVSFFYNQAYYQSEDVFGNPYFEDPTGALKISLSKKNGVTTISLSEGSGESHAPVFEFKEKTLSVGVGNSIQLELNVEMLPYAITYSSSDTTGKVTVDENGLLTVAADAEIGSSVTITASLNVPGESSPREAKCEISIASRTAYNEETAMNAIVKKLNEYCGYAEGSDDALYTCYSSSGKYYYVLKNFLGDAGKLDTLKDAVENSLLLDGFEISMDWKETTSSYGYPVHTCKYSGDGLIVEYSITLNDGVTLFQVKSYSASK